MSLSARELRLTDFRSYREKTIAFSDAITLLVGPNAVGKTNALEALQLLTTGASFRNPTPAQLIREGAEQARAELALGGDGRAIEMVLEAEAGRRRFFRNGKKLQAADVPGTLLSVLFTPDDLSMVKRGAAFRRDEIDGFARQASAGYARVLARYGKAVEQRNRLLKQDAVDPDMLDAWDDVVSQGAAALLDARLRLFRRLEGKIAEVYADMSGGEEAAVAYECSVEGALEAATKDEMREIILAALAARREEDIRRQHTTAGPHRDDIAFTIAGREARTFASQGQQRTLAIAVKMAEVLVFSEISGEMPMLLLDDVMSELDESRRAAVMGYVGAGTQTVVTTTNIAYFSDDLIRSAEVVSYG